VDKFLENRKALMHLDSERAEKVRQCLAIASYLCFNTGPEIPHMVVMAQKLFRDSDIQGFVQESMPDYSREDDLERQRLGIACVECGSTNEHWSNCSLRQPDVERVEVNRFFGLDQLSQEKVDEIAEACLSDEDKTLLLEQEAALEVIQHTSVSEQIAEECRRELESGYKRGWNDLRRS
jgi:hypothetical protein